MASDGLPNSPERELERFGDPKPPDISRKITACASCRKQKIKCYMKDSQPPCERCEKRGLSCSVNRSLQMLLESDVKWKQAMEKKIQKLEEAVKTRGKNESSTEESQQAGSFTEDATLSANEATAEGHPQDLLPATNEQDNQWKIVIDLASSPGALPGHYLSLSGSARPKTAKDLISRGIISAENAQRYFDEYQSRLDLFTYRILGDYGVATLEQIREVSPLLTAAICAVGALHLASQDFDTCYKEFLTLSAALSFSKRNTTHDIQALCIGSFWLSDLSFSLVGIAVRISAELQLHKSFFRSLQNGVDSREHYLRTRLYLLVYACDHHVSVPYGRPPLTRECEAVRHAKRFMECPHATEYDGRLISQVTRWSTVSNIFDTFGADVDRPLRDDQIPDVRRFSIALDSLRAEFADRFNSNGSIGNYPNKGVKLQYHFAKLYLFSHALRGAGSPEAHSRSPEVAWELDEFANSAVLSALSILRTVISDTEMQSYLNGLPVYFHMMIAFAVVFLLKVSTQISASVQLDVREISELMSTLLAILKRMAATIHPHHVLITITKGIEGALQRWRMPIGSPATATTATSTWSPSHGPLSQQHKQQQFVPESDLMSGDLNMDDDLLNQYFMNEYDFLLSQSNDSMPGLMPWNVNTNLPDFDIAGDGV